MTEINTDIKRYYPMVTADGCEMFPSQDDGIYVKCGDHESIIEKLLSEIKRLKEGVEIASALLPAIRNERDAVMLNVDRLLNERNEARRCAEEWKDSYVAVAGIKKGHSQPLPWKGSYIHTRHLINEA